MAKLIMTVKDMEDRENWLKAREAGIGGSDAAVIVGLSKWKSPFQLWLEKTGQAEAEDISGNERVYWGTVLEEVVAHRFTELTGKKVQRKGLLQHEDYPFLLASVDRMVIGEDAGLECKTTNRFATQAWEGDEIPDAYYVQCQHYMMVTGCKKWYIACLIGGNRFVWKEVVRDEGDIKALLDAETSFWEMVQNGTMPEADGTESCTEALRERFPGGIQDAVELPCEAEALIELYTAQKNLEKRAKANAEEAKNKLCALLGDHEAGTRGERTVTWRTQAGRKSLDKKAFAKEQPAAYDLYLDYIVEDKPTRVFGVK